MKVESTRNRSVCFWTAPGFASLAATVALVGVLALVPGLAAAQDPAPVAPATGEQTPAVTGQQARPSGGQSEGIKVHGHWTIEVREPDGTLVSRKEFENALASDVGSQFLGGAQFLAKVLAGWAIGNWEVAAEGPTQCSSLFGNKCVLNEKFSGLQAGTGPLNISAPTSGVNAGKLVLFGTFIPEANFPIHGVITRGSACLPRTDIFVAGKCDFADETRSFVFTTKRSFPSPLASTAAGQVVTITVVISFS